MMAIPLLGIGSEMPVDGEMLLLSSSSTVDVVTDEMESSNLRRNQDSLIRDFYCRCICDPIGKMMKKIPTSVVKVGLLCMTAIVILVCLTILEVVGAHRQSELQHALKERLNYRNFTQESLQWVSKHRVAASVIGQYGQRILAPYMYGKAALGAVEGTNGAISGLGSGNGTDLGRNETNSKGLRILKVIGIERMQQQNNVVRDVLVEKVSNFTKGIRRKVRDTYT